MCWSISSPATAVETVQRDGAVPRSAPRRGHRRRTATSAAFQAERFLIAVGTRPHRPAGVPFNGTSVFDSDEIVEIPRLPRSLTVIGAGVIGVEYATIFSALDVAVALVEARPTMLDFIDHELIEDFTHQLRDRGVALRFGAKVERHRVRERLAGHHPGGRAARALGNGAVHRRPRWRDRYAEPGMRAGWRRDDRGRLKVDPQTFQTEVPHIYCAGDAIGFPSLASTSMEQGRIAACHAFGVAAAARAGVLPVRHLFGAGDFDRRHERAGGARSAAFPTNAASRVSARPRAATSWG